MDPLVDVHQLSEALCKEAVRVQRVLDSALSDPEALSVVLTCAGRLTGIWTAMCLLHGWSPDEEADKEGKADALVMDWWERNHPGDPSSDVAG